jgi:DNA-binding LacI/PurR family transcriptional regulator
VESCEADCTRPVRDHGGRGAGRPNIEVAASPLIGLTSIDQHAGELGRVAAQVMLDRLAGSAGPAVTRKLEPVLVIRRSSAPSAG